MFFQVQRLGALAIICLCSHSAVSSTIERSFLAGAGDGFFVSSSYTYFNSDLDVIGYLDALPAGARPEQYDQSQIEIGYKLGNWQPYARYQKVEGSVVRPSRPFEVSSAADYETIGVVYSVGDAEQGRAARFSLSEATQSDVTIDCYERSGVVLGGACREADFQLVDGDLLLETGETVAFPVLTSSANALTAELSLDWWKRWSKLPLLVGQKLILKATEVEHENYSPLYDLQSSFLLNTPFNGVALGTLISDLKDDLPQSDPWSEAVVRYDVSASIFVGNWILGGSVGGLYAKRFEYDDPLGRVQYDTNTRAAAYVWYQFEKATVFLEAEAFSNYLLGVDPLAYTNKSSRFFEHPYGQVTVGFLATF